MPESITHDGLVERITKSMQEMDGHALADLYNEQFGNGMKYLGDSLYEQTSDSELANEADKNSAEFLSQFDDSNPIPNTCQAIADIMEERLDDNMLPCGAGADCDDIRKEYEKEYGPDALVRAYIAADESNRIN